MWYLMIQLGASVQTDGVFTTTLLELEVSLFGNASYFSMRNGFCDNVYSNIDTDSDSMLKKG